MRHPDFQDVDESMLRGGFGVLGGDGATEHHQAREKMVDQGIQYTMHCDNCGQPNNVIVDWAEFVFVNMKFAPPGWRAEPSLGGFHPNLGCASCRSLLVFIITPDEGQRQVQRGVHANRVNPNEVQTLRNQIAQRARGG